MNLHRKAWLVGGGIGSMAAAAFMIRDCVFTVEYSIRAAQMAVYELLEVDRALPAVTAHDESLRTRFETLIKAFE